MPEFSTTKVASAGRLNFKENEDAAFLPIDQIIGLGDELKADARTTFQDVENSYGVLSQTQDDLLGLTQDNPNHVKEINKLKAKYGLGDDDLNIDLGSAGFKSKILAKEKSAKSLIQDGAYKRIIRENAKATTLQQQIAELEAVNPVLANKAKKDYLDQYVNKSERVAGEPEFNLSIVAYQPMDVDKAVEEKINARFLSEPTIDVIQDANNNIVIVKKGTKIPIDKAYYDELIGGVISELSLNPQFKNNLDAYEAQTGGGTYNDGTARETIREFWRKKYIEPKVTEISTQKLTSQSAAMAKTSAELAALRKLNPLWSFPDELAAFAPTLLKGSYKIEPDPNNPSKGILTIDMGLNKGEMTYSLDRSSPAQVQQTVNSDYFNAPIPVGPGGTAGPVAPGGAIATQAGVPQSQQAPQVQQIDPATFNTDSLANEMLTPIGANPTFAGNPLDIAEVDSFSIADPVETLNIPGEPQPTAVPTPPINQDANSPARQEFETAMPDVPSPETVGGSSTPGTSSSSSGAMTAAGTPEITRTEIETIDSISVRNNNPLNISDTSFGKVLGSEAPQDGDANISKFGTMEEGLAAFYAKTNYALDGKSSAYTPGMTIDAYNKKFATSKHAAGNFRSIAKSMFGVDIKSSDTLKETIDKLGGMDIFIQVMAAKENGPLYQKMKSSGYFKTVTAQNYKKYLN